MGRRNKGHKNRRGQKQVLWLILFKKAENGYCYWCRCPLLFDDATVEHIIPLSEGGPDRISSGNVTIACLTCNNERSRITSVIRDVDVMAKRLVEMATGKRPTVERWVELVDKIIVSGGRIDVAKCRFMYLEWHGVFTSKFKPDNFRGYDAQ